MSPASKAGSPPPNVPAALDLPRGNLLLVGTGSINVTLLPSWAQLLPTWYGVTIRACLTYSAQRLVSSDALAAITGSPVWGPQFDTAAGNVPHQELGSWADLVIVAPATGSFTGKCAHGISDGLALSVVTCTKAPVIVAPALAEHAATKPSAQRNIALLKEEGYHVVGPVVGRSTHSGQPAYGAMADLGSILHAAAGALAGENPAGAPESTEDSRPASADHDNET